MNDSKTYCFGRFLIDLPADAEINGQSYEYMFGQLESERLVGGKLAFEKKMKARESQLRAGKHDEKFKLVEVVGPESPDLRIFKLTKKLIVSESFGFEAYRLTNDSVLFSMMETAFDASGIDSVLQRLETRLLPNLRFRRAGEIPNDPGFCIKDGFVADDGKTPQYEKAGISFRFKRWPDLTVLVRETRSSKLKTSLLERTSKPFPTEFAAAALEIRHLRKGKHTVGVYKGEEILDALPTDHGFHIHRFIWDVQGTPNSATEPDLYFEFFSGENRGDSSQDIRPSLTDKQAIELFDAIVNSIRLRPTTPGKSSDTGNNPNFDGGEGRRLPLGTQVSSLRSCPETGIYECGHDAPGVAARRLFVEQGRPMPSAFANPVKRGLSSLLGSHEPKEVEVMWTLVSHEKQVS